MFSDNPFKVEIIKDLPEDTTLTVYRCGPLVDLCRGPHIPNTSFVKAFSCLKASSAYWRGNKDRESLQRVYGISFPDQKRLKEYKLMLEEAKKYDHRELTKKQELFFFHPLSPGSCFFLPHGSRVCNKLLEFVRSQYWKRGYEEVWTPNMYNMQLWETSGHAANYKENMFVFEVEKQEFGLKPMNCPGHCLIFDHRVRSYRELPLRLADFGVLHRNEASGALTGLTRVRRFQQDDAHIFCRESQIKEEVKGVLEFISYMYKVFGFTFDLKLSMVIIDSQPLTVAILAFLLFGESIGYIGAAGLVLGVVGLLLLEVPALAFDANNFSLWGSGEWWMFLAAQSMAVGTVMVRWVSKYSDPVMATGWHMVIGGLPLMAISILNHDPGLSSFHELTTSDVLALLYTSIFGSAISYGVYFYNATRGSLTKLSSLTFLTPMFASVFGFIYLGETFTPLQLVGALVTVAAIYMVNYKSEAE